MSAGGPLPDIYQPYEEPLPDFTMTEAVRVPIAEAHRSDHDVLVSIANLLEENLAVLRHILTTLRSSSDSRSSAELKVSSARTAPDPTVKVYEGSPVDGLVETALTEFGRLKREADAHALDGWAEAVGNINRRLDECGQPCWPDGPPCRLSPGHPTQHRPAQP